MLISPVIDINVAQHINTTTMLYIQEEYLCGNKNDNIHISEAQETR